MRRVWGDDALKRIWLRRCACFEERDVDVRQFTNWDMVFYVGFRVCSWSSDVLCSDSLYVFKALRRMFVPVVRERR